jgi:hypothetical protein
MHATGKKKSRCGKKVGMASGNNEGECFEISRKR